MKFEDILGLGKILPIDKLMKLFLIQIGRISLTLILTEKMSTLKVYDKTN
jgi:hypothetical protein